MGDQLSLPGTEQTARDKARQRLAWKASARAADLMEKCPEWIDRTRWDALRVRVADELRGMATEAFTAGEMLATNGRRSDPSEEG